MSTIFISIASYRDSLCSKTVKSIYENAKYPKNVYLGIVEQNNYDIETESCSFDNVAKDYKANIKTVKMDFSNAKGPTYARYLATTLYDGQDFFFQIDSHSLLVKDWDEKLIKMYNDLKTIIKSDKVIISHYPASYDDYGKDVSHMVPTICSAFFNDSGMISFLGAEHVDLSKRDFLETPYIAGGMLFSKGEILQDVPFDPYLDYLFVGEEISHSIRCWTHGYRIFTPMLNIIYHFFTRENEPKIWTDKKYSDKDAFRKIKMLIGLEPANWGELPHKYSVQLDLYGLGKEKTLRQYYDFAGIDVKNKTVVKNFCKDTIEVKNYNNNNDFKSISLLLLSGLSAYIFYKLLD